MKRMVSSLRPFGAVSVSMSVTKPYLYLSPATARTVSIVLGADAIILFVSTRLGWGRFAGRERIGRGWSGTVGQAGRHRECQFGQRDALHGVAHGIVDAAPAAARRAQRFDVAGPGAMLDADGERNRAVDGAHDVGSRNRPGRAGQPVAALGTALRHQDARPGQRSQQLADGGGGKTGSRRQVEGVVAAIGLDGHLARQYHAVVCQSAEPDHETASFGQLRLNWS